MTKEEFMKTRFSPGMKVKVRKEVYDVASVDFEEMLIGVADGYEECSECGSATIHISWKRCENCELVTHSVQ